MRRFKLFLAVLSIAVVTLGCSAQKRAQRALDKAKRIYPEMFVDTTLAVDVEVITPERKAVGQFPLEFGRPFVTREDGVITTTLVTQDSIYSETIVEPDTMMVTGEADVPVIIQGPTANGSGGFWKQVRYLGWLLIAILLIILVINLTKK